MSIVPTVWKPFAKVNTSDAPPMGSHVSSTNEQSVSKVVALEGGGYLVAWEDSSGTWAAGLEPRDIAGQIYDALGNKVGAEFGLSTFYADFDQKMPDIAALPGGGFLCIYQTTDAAMFGDGENVAVQVYDASGGYVRTDDFRQGNGGPLVNDTAPTVVSYADGAYTIFYTDDTGGGSRIVGRFVSATGVIGPIFQVETAAGAADLADSALLAGGAESSVLVYEQGANVAVSILSKAGIILQEGAAVVGHDAKVAALANGNFVMVWEDTNGDGAGNAGIKAAIYDQTLGIVGSILVPPTTTVGPQEEVAVTGLADGGFVVTWSDVASGSIRGQTYGATGAKIGGEFVVASVDTNFEPSVALLADGRIVVSVTNQAGGNRDIYSGILDPRTSPITGTGDADVLTSRIDGATVRGLGGADTLHGFAGNDTLDGGAGNDTLIGRGGNDIYVVNSGDTITEIFGEGARDRLRATTNFTLAAGIDVEVLETADLQAGTSAISLAGNEISNTIFGNNGENRLYGLAGNDALYGYSGADTLDGGTGVDFLDGGAGNDILIGGADNDVYIVNSGDTIVELTGGGSADRARATTNFTLANNVAVEIVETLDTEATTAISLAGNNLDNLVLGNNGENRLYGQGGTDTLYGYGGNDTLDGGAGNDTLYGGLGNDTLTGGGDSDVFVFNTTPNATTNRDTITDFNVPQDTIHLENAIFTSLVGAGVLSAGQFFIGASADDADCRIVYNAANGALIYDANGNAAGGSVQFATLAAGLTLTNADFFII
jgi:Ca2+-binding RTX toxin-like protein